jgi:hypothetical protein
MGGKIRFKNNTYNILYLIINSFVWLGYQTIFKKPVLSYLINQHEDELSREDGVPIHVKVVIRRAIPVTGERTNNRI